MIVKLYLLSLNRPALFSSDFFSLNIARRIVSAISVHQSERVQHNNKLKRSIKAILLYIKLHCVRRSYCIIITHTQTRARSVFTRRGFTIIIYLSTRHASYTVLIVISACRFVSIRFWNYSETNRRTKNEKKVIKGGVKNLRQAVNRRRIPWFRLPVTPTLHLLRTHCFVINSC